MPDHDLSVIIPAAGLGRRMKSFGPKSLIPLDDGRTVLRRQLDLVRDVFPAADVIVVVGFESEKVIKTLPPGVRTVENEKYEETSVSRSISMGLRASTAKRALIVYGDLVFNRASLEGLPTDRSAVLVDSQKRLPADDIGVTVDGKHAVHFDFGLPTKWCSIAMLTGPELTLFKQLGSHRDRRRRLGWEILNDLLDRGGELLAVEQRNMRLLEIESSKDIKRSGSVTS